MNLIGTALAGMYVVVATRSAYATREQAGDSPGAGGENITCASGEEKFVVSQPDTTVKVTFPGTVSSRETSPKPDEYIFDANCDKPALLSNVCPGATVQTTQQSGNNDTKEEVGASTAKTIVTLEFPQLPASQQEICVKCPAKSRSEPDNACKALITVAAASPQGPQACAVGGSSIRLELDEAGSSAQFKCGKNRTLEPTERTKAYKDDCSTVETLKDMARSDGSKSRYVTVTVDKLKKKKLCYLCQPGASGQRQRVGQDAPCKVYVHVSGSTKLSSSVPYGLALPCLAAMLHFT